MSIGTLAANLLGNMLTGKAKILGWGVIRAGEKEQLERVKEQLMLVRIIDAASCLTNFEIQNHQSEPKLIMKKKPKKTKAKKQKKTQ